MVPPFPRDSGCGSFVRTVYKQESADCTVLTFISFKLNFHPFLFLIINNEENCWRLNYVCLV